MSNVVLFKRAEGAEQLAMTTKTSKAGYATTAYLSKKAYGIEKQLKGAALGRAHLQYRIDIGMAGNVNISTMLTRGEILAQKVVTTKEGFKVSFTRAGVLVAAPQPKPEEVAATLSDETLLALIAARAAKLAPAVQPVV